MTTYYSKSEIETAMRSMVVDDVKKCIDCDEISADFIDLIKYNFLAKYVSLNRKTHSIEIGVEDKNTNGSHYPVINIFSFPLQEKENLWLDSSFKFENNDLVFYGGLINRKKYNHKNSEVIVM
jgi:hypothetical protein